MKYRKFDRKTAQQPGRRKQPDNREADSTHPYENSAVFEELAAPPLLAEASLGIQQSGMRF